LLAMAKGNSRLILGYALACAGPICGAFGYEPPGIQFVGKGGIGKTPLAAGHCGNLGMGSYPFDPTPESKARILLSWTPRARSRRAVPSHKTLR
jgi:hypothetical protein